MIEEERGDVDVGDNRYNFILLCFDPPPPIAQSKAFMFEINISAVFYPPPPFNFYCRSLDLIQEERGDGDVGDNRYNFILLCFDPPPP